MITMKGCFTILKPFRLVLFLAALNCAYAETPVFTECPPPTISKWILVDVQVEGGVKTVPREYCLFAPNLISPPRLVIFLHGQVFPAKTSAYDVMARSGWVREAKREGLVVAFPLGNRLECDHSLMWNFGSHWANGNKGNCADDPTYVPPKDVDDVAFIRALINDIQQNQVKTLPKDKVFVSGMSAGAIMTYRLVCELSDLIAGAATNSGLMADSVYATCKATDTQKTTQTRPVPFLHLQGTLDDVVELNGSNAHLASMSRSTRTIGLNNQCSNESVSTTHDYVVADGTSVDQKHSIGCKAPVETLIVNNMGHTLAGALNLFKDGTLGNIFVSSEYNSEKATQEIDGRVLFDRFFKMASEPDFDPAKLWTQPEFSYPLQNFEYTYPYIASLYTKVLLRSGQKSELDGWFATPLSRTDIPLSFVNSAEFRNSYVSSVFFMFIRRTPALNEVAKWANTTLTQEQILIAIAASNEAYRDSGGTDSSFVTGLYTKLLKRAPDSEGMTYWIAQLKSGVPRTIVVQGFVRSSEYIRLLLFDWYGRYLFRAPDAYALGWGVEMGNGSLTWEQVRSNILSGVEYYRANSD